MTIEALRELALQHEDRGEYRKAFELQLEIARRTGEAHGIQYENAVHLFEMAEKLGG